MKKLLFLLPGLLTLGGLACGEHEGAAADAAGLSAASATATKGFYYVLDATGRHLRSGHLPHNHQDHNWLLEMQAETTDAEILHIWLDEEFVTVEL
jgi:hypothetical protein